MLTLNKKPGLFCISFDAVALSGIIVEFLKVAKIFYQNDYLIYLDLGYEIKADKNKFFHAYTNEKKLFPVWVELIKIIDEPFKNYSPELVYEIFKVVAADSSKLYLYEQIIEDYSNYIAGQLLQAWNKLNIQVVIVENGTLPENIIFTKSLYKAIESYGAQHQLNKYVIWRDHDLMWSSEANLSKYGRPPYPDIPKLSPSKHIAHIVLHQADYEEAVKWSPNVSISILKNTFQPLSLTKSLANKIRSEFREYYHIPEKAYLIARFTRIIPQKKIDRDIHLLHLLYKICQSQQKTPNIYLAVAGSKTENPQEFQRLTDIITNYQLDDYVIFTGSLIPVGFAKYCHERSVMDLIIASDLCSFMTSYYYESFGNPISEAICLERAYLTTCYRRYQHVYGSLGYQGLVFAISEEHDVQVDRQFALQVWELLTDKKKRESLIIHNSQLMQAQQKNDLPLTKKMNNLLNLRLI